MLPLRHYLVSEVLCLITIDALMAFGWIYLYLSYASVAEMRSAPESSALVGASLATVVMWSLGLYDRWALFDRGHIASRLLATTVAGYLMVTSLHYASGPVGGEGGGGFLWAAAAVTGLTTSVALLHLLFPQLSTVAQLRRRVLLVSGDADAGKLADAMRQASGASFSVVGHVPLSELTGGGSSLVAEAKRQGVSEIVVLGGCDSLRLRELLRCRVHGIAITDYQSFWERETGRLFLDDLDPSWLVYSNGFRNSRIDDAGKRGLDILLSLIGLGLALPVMALVACVIPLDSPGPVLYAQKRVGRHGREFVLYKFRSMRCDAEKDGVPQWAAKNDSRITRLGGWLRKLRLDELPQLYNVLKGDMSLIGPRPERAFFVEQLSRTIPYYDLRHQVRPGLTGWAQVSYKYTDSVEDAKIKFSYDLYYLKNRGLLLDLLIVLQTVQVVLFPKDVH